MKRNAVGLANICVLSTAVLVLVSISVSLYTGMDDGSGNITWTAQTMENVDQLKQYDTQATMELYLSTGSSFQEAGTETVEGKEAVRYDGPVAKNKFAIGPYLYSFSYRRQNFAPNCGKLFTFRACLRRLHRFGGA